MTDLKPCPFCGSEGEEVALHGPEVGADSYRGWNVQCYGCNVETAHEDDRAQAVTAWNTRAALSPPQVDRDGLGSGSSSATEQTNPDGLTETLHSAGQCATLFRRDDEDPEVYAALVRSAARENDALVLADKIRGAALRFLKERDAIALVAGRRLTFDAWTQSVEAAVAALREACVEPGDQA
jgi:Lar family restriction alleviation protein